MEKAAGSLNSGDRPVRHQPSVTTLKSRQRKLSQIQQLLFALLTPAAELPHGRLEKKSGLCIWNSSHTRLLSLFSFWRALPPAHLAPLWEHSHQFCRSQLSRSSTALREPHKTPGTGGSQDWLTADIQFQPCGVLSHQLPFQGLLLLQKICWASEQQSKKTPISPNVGSRHWLRETWLRTLLGKAKKEKQTASWSTKSGRWINSMKF